MMGARIRKRRRKKWEYMVLCPDSEAGYAVLLQETGDEGWEAVLSWADIIDDGQTQELRNHILFKRPV